MLQCIDQSGLFDNSKELEGKRQKSTEGFEIRKPAEASRMSFERRNFGPPSNSIGQAASTA